MAAPEIGQKLVEAREEGEVMATKDAYTTLGLDPRCTDSQIVAMYRHLVKLHHPDKGGDAKRFCEIQDAYEALGSSERRAAYDRRRAEEHRKRDTETIPHTFWAKDPRTFWVQDPQEAAYLRKQPNKDRGRREQFKNQEKKRTTDSRRETGERADAKTTEPREGSSLRALWWRAAKTAAVAGVVSSILRWVQTGKVWKGGSVEDLIDQILWAGGRDLWTWFAIVAAGGIVAWLQILRPRTYRKVLLTGVLVAISAGALAGAEANPLAWQAGAWAVAGTSVAMARNKRVQHRIRNRLAAAR